MKKTLIRLLTATLAVVLLLAGCGEANPPAENNDPPAKTNTQTIPAEHTDANGFELYMVPDNYTAPCVNGGTIETLTYTAEVYSVEDKEGLAPGTLSEEKKLYVYLPAGYDATKPYDILYLLHGSNETVDYWFVSDNTVGDFYRGVKGITESVHACNYTKNVVDNLFQNGDCSNMIIVAPTYFSSLRDENYYGDSWDDTMFWLDAFEKELRNDIIPLVESKYLTYANGDTSAAGLKASRDHRAIAGFSRGSRFIMRVGIPKMVDTFSWFGCFHGIQDMSVDVMKSVLAENPDCPIHYWYIGLGKKDYLSNDLRTLCEAVESELTTEFVVGRNYASVDKPQGSHHYDSALMDLYNFCHIVFKEA